MKRLFLLTIFVLFAFAILAQAPQGFNYQGVARNAEGAVLPDASLVIRIGIVQNDALLWQEDHSVQTNAQGLFSLIIGDEAASNTGGSADSFTEIPWGAGGVEMVVSVDPGSGFTDLGTAPLMSVPYALHAQNGWEIRNDTAYSSLPIAIDHRNRESQAPLFEVKNDQGNPVFAVYNDGVVVYVDESKKGAKGGFAVGGYNSAKGTIAQKYAHITPDSVMFWVPENAAEKGVKGGFAVGGYNKNAKGPGLNLLEVTSNHTRIQFDTSNTKGAKGGFAVGGYNKNTKAEPVNLMSLTQKNYLIGENAGRLVDSLGGRRNLMIGYEAGYNTTTGSFNSFIGYRSGYSGKNGTGSNNVMIGENTGAANTTGSNNIFLGNNAGGSNITGNSNVFIGQNAGSSNLYGDYNTFIGYQAGNNLTGGTGTWEGDFNTIIGYEAGHDILKGYKNVLIGYQAGYNIRDNRYNIIIGEGAGYNLQGELGNEFSGQSNLLLGLYAGQALTTGSANIFMGLDVGYSCAPDAKDNIWIGLGAGRSSASSGSVFIGKYAGYSENSDNKLIIQTGYTGTDNQNNALVYGDFSTKYFRHNGNVSINYSSRPTWGLTIGMEDEDNFALVAYGPTFCSEGAWQGSDQRLKKNIETYTGALDKILSIRGVSFNWRSDEFPDRHYEDYRQVGVIAQEVEEVIPEVVHAGPEGYKSVDYSKITAVLIEAVKEQQKQIESMQAEIDALKAQGK